MRHIILLISAIIVLMPALYAQSTDDVRLAYSYYNNREYDKAAYMFESLFSQSRSMSYFNLYITCLTRGNETEKAEKAARKQVSASKNDPCYMVILGNVYKAQNNLEKAQQQYAQALENMRTDRGNAIQLTNMLLSADEKDLAEQVLLKAQEASGQDYSSDLFAVYSSSRNFKKMSETALDIIAKDQSQMINTESLLQYHINNDINNEFYDILRAAVLQRIQQNPLPQYSELMIWLQIMKKNFRMAIIQAKGLDKRLGEEGQRLINIGDQALAAKDYASASEAYKYVAAKGKGYAYYQRASFGLLKSMYEQVKEGSISNIEEIKYLEAQYASTFADFGINSKTLGEIANYARIETYHLNKPDSAQLILERALATQGINYAQKAQLYLELGDVQLYKGEPWDALMTYAKVENDNKQNEYGDEAKFRKARIAYYTGNFKWAASQLDVLKAATTKLVANDAMELSLLISDNAERESEITGDTTSAIMENEEASKDLRIYARADMYHHQNLPGKAIASLDSIMEFHKQSPLVDEACYLKAMIYERQHKMDSAATYYKKVADEYAYDILADKACYKYARIAETVLHDADSAKKYYMKILADYPGSVYAVESRERYRQLSGE
ncbi:MAG: hypothetical protein MJZ66_08205 [Bacteroidales bacterium]|nr:hypothetical protein [Bacteroidales bacterium]